MSWCPSPRTCDRVTLVKGATSMRVVLAALYGLRALASTVPTGFPSGSKKSKKINHDAMKEDKINIANINGFQRGVAQFERIAQDPRTHVQAWRRHYPLEPWRDRVELFISDGRPFYPFDQIKRFIRSNDPRLQEKLKHYLENGLERWFPGDEPQSVFDTTNTQ